MEKEKIKTKAKGSDAEEKRLHERKGKRKWRGRERAPGEKRFVSLPEGEKGAKLPTPRNRGAGEKLMPR